MKVAVALESRVGVFAPHAVPTGQVVFDLISRADFRFQFSVILIGVHRRYRSTVCRVHTRAERYDPRPRCFLVVVCFGGFATIFGYAVLCYGHAVPAMLCSGRHCVGHGGGGQVSRGKSRLSFSCQIVPVCIGT